MALRPPRRQLPPSTPVAAPCRVHAAGRLAEVGAVTAALALVLAGRAAVTVTAAAVLAALARLVLRVRSLLPW